MLLNEVFDQPVKWKVIDHQEGFLEVVFTVGPVGYTFWATAVRDAEDEMIQPPHFDIEFYAHLPSKENPHKSYGITKSGNQQQVFATILDIIKEFVDEYNPAIMSFEAKEPSRFKLYKRLVATLLPSWKMIVKGYIIQIVNPGANYVTI